MSSRKNRSPEKQAQREKIREILQNSGVSNMKEIQDLFKETIMEFMERGLAIELEEELGYSKYDCKNKNLLYHVCRRARMRGPATRIFALQKS